jgi:hypothetical protein
MCPGVDSASKNEYQDIAGGKDVRCVRVTTLPSSCAECLENSGALTYQNHNGVGLLYLSRFSRGEVLVPNRREKARDESIYGYEEFRSSRLKQSLLLLKPEIKSIEAAIYVL